MCMCVFYVRVYILCVYMVGGGRGGTGSKSLEGEIVVDFIFLLSKEVLHKLP